MTRPRQDDIEERLIQAWHRLAASLPYEQVTMTALAQEAGVGKPALYRRFPTKAHLAFAAGVMGSVPEPLEDHGSLHADLIDSVGALVAALHAMPRQVYAEQIGAAIADPDFADRVQEVYARPALDAIMRVWERGVARGEVDPGLDGRTALNDLAGAVIFEVMVRHGPGDAAYLDQLVRRFVPGVAPSPRPAEP